MRSNRPIRKIGTASVAEEIQMTSQDGRARGVLAKLRLASAGAETLHRVRRQSGARIARIALALLALGMASSAFAIGTTASTTTLSSSAASVSARQSVTFTATVAPTSGAGTTPTGTVVFKDGTTVIAGCPGTLASGVSTCTTATLTAGSHTVTASYGGDTTYAVSTASVTETVAALPTTITLTSGTNPSVVSGNVLFTATVTGSSPTGNVTFISGVTGLGVVALSGGQATKIVTFSSAGTRAMTATYAGDGYSGASTSAAVSQVVNPIASSVTLSPSANPVAAGHSLTMTALVTGSTPTGTVQFKDGATNLGSGVTLIGGQATSTIASPTEGAHNYSATYSGDSSNSGSSANRVINVAGTTSTTTLAASTSAATPTTSVTFTAAITGSSPTGSVVFRDGATVLHTSTVSGGAATWSQALSASGLHTITASYGGDTTNAPSVSTQALVQVSTGGTTQPAGAALQWNYQYDAQGNLTQVVDANAATTQQAYDSLSRTRQITQPVPATGQAAPVIALGYDLQDQPATVTDPRSLTTTYTTDGLGNTTALASPDTGTTTKTYYDSGLLKTALDARGRTSTYTYNDALDRLTSIAYSDGGTGTTFTYDQGANGVGHLTSVTDESSSTTFTYDGLGRVLTKTQVSGPAGSQRTFTLTYTWGTTGSATGKLVSVKYPSNAVVIYGYDTAGRVNDVSVTGTDGVVTKVLTGLSYNALSQPQSWAWGTGAVPYQRSFDGYGRLVSYPLGNPAGTGISAGVTRTLAFDAAGRIVGYSHTTPTNWDQAFAYDGLDRLVSATLVGGIPYGYAYDATGNRTQTTINGTGYADTVSTTNNWYTTVANAAGTAAQGYDAAGHLTSDASGTYTYSGRGRLKTELRAGSTFNYLYNAFEQRVYKAGPSTVITTGSASYAYDEAGHLEGEYDATGKAVYETVYLGDMPVAALTQPVIGQTTVSYVYADHLNTARVIVRPADQAILWTWGSNEPFGQTQANSNPSALGTFTYNPRFPGQVADTESGWFYNWNRDYNPSLGRYVQSDPLGLSGGGMSTYAYAAANPLMNVDPNGKQVAQVIVGIPVLIVGCALTPACRDAVKNAMQSKPSESSPTTCKPAIPDVEPGDDCEYYALAAAKSGAGVPIMDNLADAPRLEAFYGAGPWIKMQYTQECHGGKKLVIHYFHSQSSGRNEELKFVPYGSGTWSQPKG